MSIARLSVSSWSLNNTLGKPAFHGVEHSVGKNWKIPSETHNQGELSLLELPQALANFGIHTLEITHFHLPSIDNAYLKELKSALDDANVELFSLLIDDGDITHPEHHQRDVAWMLNCLDIAASLGSQCARVIAGKQSPTSEVLNLSINNLKILAEKANDLGLNLMTENWFNTASTPESLLQIIESLDGQLDLCLDFGNWEGVSKYSAFEKIAPYAKSCHAKAFFENGTINSADYKKCLDIVHTVNFSGPHTLIFESPKPKNEWDGLAIEKEIVSTYL